MRRNIGIASLLAYVAAIPLANWLIENVGTQCLPEGGCVVPVWPGLYCPSGSLMIGLSLVLRDIIQRTLGAHWSLGAIVAGCLISSLVAPAELVLASVVAFTVSELLDFAIYTPLYRRRFVVAVIVSSAAGAVVDSVIFLQLAFGSLDLLAGLVLGKIWMVALCMPLMLFVRNKVPVAA